jgi:hypothetical protein
MKIIKTGAHPLSQNPSRRVRIKILTAYYLY